MAKKAVLGVAILGGVSIIGYSIYSFYRKQMLLLKDFKWKIYGLKISDVKSNLLKGIIDFRFDSVSDIEITIKSFYLDLYLNGEYIGYINETKENVIPARGYNVLSFEFSINPQYIVSDITDILVISSKIKDAMIGLEGFIQLKSGFVSATAPIKCNCSMKNYECDC